MTADAWAGGELHARLRRVWGSAACRECGRVFDLTDETDAEEWAYGHDCDVEGWGAE